MLHAAIRELLKHVRYKFYHSKIYIKFRQITNCNKSLLIVINIGIYKSSIVNSEIMPDAVQKLASQVTNTV